MHAARPHGNAASNDDVPALHGLRAGGGGTLHNPDLLQARGRKSLGPRRASLCLRCPQRPAFLSPPGRRLPLVHAVASGHQPLPLLQLLLGPRWPASPPAFEVVRTLPRSKLAIAAAATRMRRGAASGPELGGRRGAAWGGGRKIACCGQQCVWKSIWPALSLPLGCRQVTLLQGRISNARHTNMRRRRLGAVVRWRGAMQCR